ncbi:MAG: T9SS type A sorting domain-containing protein, partial [Bacteroidetes bacterium]|nr:T9SS type A sorting domain-containing protein [Bacteroidota bacterium]
DCKNWQFEGTVDGAGNSNTLLFYSYLVTIPCDKISYYRLKQTDFDGKRDYSDIVAVKNCDKNLNELAVFPNPGSDKIEITGIYDGVVEIINVEGQIVKTLNISDINTTVDITNLLYGVYTIKVITNNKIFVKKLIVE